MARPDTYPRASVISSCNFLASCLPKPEAVLHGRRKNQDYHCDTVDPFSIAALIVVSALAFGRKPFVPWGRGPERAAR